MSLIALTGPDSVASGKKWEAAEVQELNLETYKKLKINMILKVDIFDSFAGLRQMFLKVGRRSTSKKYKLERLALRAVDKAGELIPPRAFGISSAVFYFYNRSGNISAAHSDMPVKITRVQIMKK